MNQNGGNDYITIDWISHHQQSDRRQVLASLKQFLTVAVKYVYFIKC